MVVSTSAAVIEAGFEKGASVASNLSTSASNADEAVQLKGVAKMSKGVSNVMKNTGIVGAWIGAGTSVAEVAENPSAKNITKAVLYTGLAVLQTAGRVNPVMASVLTAIEVANAIFEWW